MLAHDTCNVHFQHATRPIELTQVIAVLRNAYNWDGGDGSVTLHRSLGLWILPPMVVTPARASYYEINTVNMIPWYGSTCS